MVLLTLLAGDEEREGIKMGEEEQDIVGQLCGVWKAKSEFGWSMQRGQ